MRKSLPSNYDELGILAVKPRAYFLKPTELLVCQDPTLITTILGTCVSVCLFDPQTKIGGINHYMLPLCEKTERASPKYGDIAIAMLIKKMLVKGAIEKNLVAKVFGGSETMHSIFRVGKKNIEIAVKLLKEKNIQIQEMEVGGQRGQKIRFSSWNHEVLVDILM